MPRIPSADDLPLEGPENVLELDPVSGLRSETAGPKQIAAALFEQQRLSVCRYLTSLGLRPQVASEIAQESFLRLYRHLRSKSRSENLRGWISALKMKEPGEVKTESLGQQTIEGLSVTGTRTTRTIPAGAIGNDQPIEIVSDTWYSPDLQMVIMSKHGDPQIGETTYRLSNIQQAEPPHSLFEVPANYTIREEKPVVIEQAPLSLTSK